MGNLMQPVSQLRQSLVYNCCTNIIYGCAADHCNSMGNLLRSIFGKCWSLCLFVNHCQPFQTIVVSHSKPSSIVVSHSKPFQAILTLDPLKKRLNWATPWLHHWHFPHGCISWRRLEAAGIFQHLQMTVRPT